MYLIRYIETLFVTNKFHINTLIQLDQLIFLHIKATETYCVSYRKNTAKRSSSVERTKQNILMPVSNFAFCGKVYEKSTD